MRVGNNTITFMLSTDESYAQDYTFLSMGSIAVHLMTYKMVNNGSNAVWCPDRAITQLPHTYGWIN